MEKDQLEMLDELDSGNVDYLLIGGQAVSAHGIPRYTKDMDVWIRSDRGTAEAVYHALTHFGAPLHGTSIDDLCDGKTFLQIGVEPSRIDILQSVSGLTFEAAWPQRQQIKMDDGRVIPVISLLDLIRNKEASGRPQDLADVALLRKVLADGVA